jgi:prolipoprotein diacylglyceryl transferase
MPLSSRPTLTRPWPTPTVADMWLASIPAPPGSDIGIGPLRLHVYGALIVAGVLAAVWLADRRWRARGGTQGTFSAIAMWGVPGGLIGARLYHVATDYELYTHHPLDAFKIWQGGLGIWGGIAGGVLLGWVYIRRHDLDFGVLLDCAAPALALAQAIGRWGNYFNQELFGRPTSLPWGLQVDAAHRPLAYAHAATFQPTFLYESLWDLAVVGLVLLVEKRVPLRKGYLFWVYVALYTFGRFFTEYLRIDFAHKILGLRLNDWTSIVIFVVAVVIVLRMGIVRADRTTDKAEPAGVDDPDPEGARVPVAAGQAGATLATTDLPEEIRPATDDGDDDVLESSLVRDLDPESAPEPESPDPAPPDNQPPV